MRICDPITQDYTFVAITIIFYLSENRIIENIYLDI